jgi:hypothetical protein
MKVSGQIHALVALLPGENICTVPGVIVETPPFLRISQGMEMTKKIRQFDDAVTVFLYGS